MHAIKEMLSILTLKWLVVGDILQITMNTNIFE